MNRSLDVKVLLGRRKREEAVDTVWATGKQATQGLHKHNTPLPSTPEATRISSKLSAERATGLFGQFKRKDGRKASRKGGMSTAGDAERRENGNAQLGKEAREPVPGHSATKVELSC